jgi:hypothetical protein
VLCSGFRVQGAGVRVQGSGFRVQGSGCQVASIPTVHPRGLCIGALLLRQYLLRRAVLAPAPVQLVAPGELGFRI